MKLNKQAKIISLLFGIILSIQCSASPVTVTLSKTCGIDMRLWQVGTSSHNVRINSDLKTFSVDFPTDTKICAYVNQDSYCSCWGYKYCEGPQPLHCPTGSGNKDLLVLIIGGCATITKGSNKIEIPISCDPF